MQLGLGLSIKNSKLRLYQTPQQLSGLSSHDGQVYHCGYDQHLDKVFISPKYLYMRLIGNQTAIEANTNYTILNYFSKKGKFVIQKRNMGDPKVFDF